MSTTKDGGSTSSTVCNESNTTNHEITDIPKNLTTNKIISSLELERINKEQYLTTGCKVIDSILEGGIPIKGITEISGEAGAGKTQICLQLALTVQYPLEYGGLLSGAIYVCTEDVFPSKRFNELIQHVPEKYFSENRKTLSDNVFIDHVMDPEKFNACISTKIPQLLRRCRIGLIVIDSIAGIYRFEYETNDMERTKDMQRIGKKLIDISDEYNIAVVCINQISDNVNENLTKVPALGLAWHKYVTTQLSISRNISVINNSQYPNNCIRELSIKSCPYLPCASCPFIITSTGIKGL